MAVLSITLQNAASVIGVQMYDYYFSFLYSNSYLLKLRYIFAATYTDKSKRCTNTKIWESLHQIDAQNSNFESDR